MYTYFQDDRTCWMEAISSDSSANFKPTATEPQYEPIIQGSSTEAGEAYSYARVSRSDLHHQPQLQERKDLKSLYDDPDDPIMTQAQIASQNRPTTKLSPLEYENPAKARRARARSKSPSKAPLATTERVVPDNQATVPPAGPRQGVHLTVSEDKDTYDDVDATASIDMYEDMSQSNQPLQVIKSPRRSVTVPKELSTLAETSVENLSVMNPNEAQLWLLNQMQKLVEKFAGVYESTAIGPLPKTAVGTPTKSNRGELLPTQEIKEVYDEDLGEEPIPPVPPRTYSCTVQKTEETSTSGRAISRQYKSAYVRNKVPPSSTNTKPLAAKKSPHHHRPPLQPKPDSPSKLYDSYLSF